MKFAVIFLSLLVISVVFISGCTQIPQTKQKNVTGKVLDDAYNVLEEELEEAVENITAKDIENALLP